MSKIMIITTSQGTLGDSDDKTGCHFQELIVPYDTFVQEGNEVDIFSIKGGKIPLTGVDESDPLQQKYLDNKDFMKKIEHSSKFTEVSRADNDVIYPSDETLSMKTHKLEEYAAIYLPGGHGCMWDLPDNEDLQKLLASHYDRGGIIGAICHGPAALANVKLSNGKYLIDGKKITCFSNEEEREHNMTQHLPFFLETKLRERGAQYHCENPGMLCIQVDDRLATGQNPAASKSLAKDILTLVDTKRKVGAK